MVKLQLIKNQKSIYMKNRFKIIISLAVGILLLPTCKDPDLRMPELQDGVIPVVQKDETKSVDIKTAELATFSGAVVVDLYYDAKPKSMDLMVSMNGSYTNSAVLQANITSYPTTVNFTCAQLAELLPDLESADSLKGGDFFTFYVNMTLEDGTVINGNDTLYTGWNSSIANLPGSSLNVTYNVLCSFNPTLAIGSYKAESESWNVSGNVTITADPSDPYTIIIDGLAEDVDLLVSNGNKLTLHIDPETSEITGEKTVLAPDCGGWAPAYAVYTNYYYLPISGTYSNCDGTYQITFDLGSDQEDFGEYDFTFTRN